MYMDACVPSLCMLCMYAALPLVGELLATVAQSCHCCTGLPSCCSVAVMQHCRCCAIWPLSCGIATVVLVQMLCSFATVVWFATCTLHCLFVPP